jgi:hypothetical protein
MLMPDKPKLPDCVEHEPLLVSTPEGSTRNMQSPKKATAPNPHRYRGLCLHEVSIETRAGTREQKACLTRNNFARAWIDQAPSGDKKGPGCSTGWNQDADSWGSIESTWVSTGKQDHGICFIVYPLTSSFLLSCKTLDAFARVSDVHQSILCFEIQFCFKLARISSEVKHRHEYART